MSSTLTTLLIAVSIIIIASAITTNAQQQPTYDPYLAMRMLYFAKAAVCPIENIKDWDCGETCNFNPGFQPKGVYQNKSDGGHVQVAFTGYDSVTKSIVWAGRGTETWKSWIVDFETELVPLTGYPECQAAIGEASCRVEKGFLSVWNSYADGSLSDIKSLIQQHPEVRQVRVTGHSLGAAASLLASLFIKKMLTQMNLAGKLPVEIYNFGEPRVGNPKTAAWIYTTAVGHRQFRVVNSRDPVPHVPTMSMGYLHMPQEIWYKKSGQNTSWVECKGTATHEDPDCSDSILAIDPFDHLKYLGVYTGCSGTGSKEHKQALREVEKYKKSDKFQKFVKKMMKNRRKNQN